MSLSKSGSHLVIDYWPSWNETSDRKGLKSISNHIDLVNVKGNSVIPGFEKLPKAQQRRINSYLELLELSLKQMQDAHDHESLFLQAEIARSHASQRAALRTRFQDRMRVLASALEERRKSNLNKLNALLKQLGLAPVSLLPEVPVLAVDSSVFRERAQVSREEREIGA